MKEKLRKYNWEKRERIKLMERERAQETITEKRDKKLREGEKM